MEIIREIAIFLKDRVVVLDRDLSERKIPMTQGTEFWENFRQMKGRHYKKLKQGGSGWSFPIDSFSTVNHMKKNNFGASVSEDTNLTTRISAKQNDYDVDIPESVRDFFQEYKKYCG